MARTVGQVFVASTASDIPEYRDRVREAIRRMGQMDIAMEDFNAESRPSLETCLSKVRESDVVIVIVGHTYGSIPPTSQGGDDHRCYTWREAAEAIEKGKAVLAFELDENVRGPSKERDRLDRAKTSEEAAQAWTAVRRLDEFRQFLRDRVIVKQFATPDELKSEVIAALSERERNRTAIAPAEIVTAVTGFGANLFRRIRSLATAPRFLLLFLLLVGWDFGFAWRQSKLGEDHPTLDGRITWDSTQAANLFSQLDSTSRHFYAKTELTLDGIYPLLYGLLFVMIIARLASARFRWLLVIPVLAVAADYTENISIARAFSQSTLPSDVVSVARVATTAKWSFTILSGVAILIAAWIHGRWLRQRNWKRAERLGLPTPSDAHMADLNGVLERELDHVHAHRHRGRDRKTVSRNLVGLALSGGGIRSATTNLGVLQALSRMNILPMVDYISTVSGGGYIGACLSSLLSWNGRVAKPKPDDLRAPFRFRPHEQPVFATDWARFPFRAEISRQMPQRMGADLVAHLRTHGNFLIARAGLLRRETMRSIGTLLTGTVYHLFFFVATLFAVSTLYLAAMLATAPDARQALSDGAARMARDEAAAYAAQQRVPRPPLVPVDSTITRTAGAPACPGCQVQTKLEPPTLWKRLAWNAEVMTRVLTRASSAWSRPLDIPRPLRPIAWAFLAGIVTTLGALVWILFALHAYLKDEDSAVARPKRGESEEDAFERHVLIRLGVALSTVFVLAIAIRVWIWKRNQQQTLLSAEDELLWLFTPLAAALGARVSGFTISVLGQSYARRWTRRMRSLWGAFQGISIYGIWVTLLFAVLPLAMYALSDNTGAVGWSTLGSLLVTRLLTSRTAGANGAGIAKVSKLPPGIRNALLGVAVTVVLLLGLLYFGSMIAPGVDGPIAAAKVFGVAAVLFATFAWSVNPNRLSPHYFYRDRLAETYLLSELPDNAGRIRLYRDAMEMPLHCLHGDLENDTVDDPTSPWRNGAPYHLISAAINMAGSRDLTRKDRKSGYWLFSKLYCGSVHTGFRETRAYRNGETKVARAVAISGAAASSAMGRITFFAQAFATVLFNVRLGQWIENPGHPESEKGQEPGANWPSYLWREITTDTVETSRLVNLSDGGHTGDNVGIYPLLQRRCKVIIACDAEGDSALTFGSFTEALRHAYVDMGIDVDIDLTMIRPDPTTGRSRSHCAVGRIRYPDRPQQESFLIYLKNSLTGDEPEPVLNYKARNPVFPHETTADQFFDDAQFESYRSLGLHIAEHTFSRWVRSPSFSVAKDRHHPSAGTVPANPSIA